MFSNEKETPRFNLHQEPKQNQLQLINGASSLVDIASPELDEQKALFQRRKTMKLDSLSREDLLWFSK